VIINRFAGHPNDNYRIKRRPVMRQDREPRPIRHAYAVRCEGYWVRGKHFECPLGQTVAAKTKRNQCPNCAVMTITIDKAREHEIDRQFKEAVERPRRPAVIRPCMGWGHGDAAQPCPNKIVIEDNTKRKRCPDCAVKHNNVNRNLFRDRYRDNIDHIADDPRPTPLRDALKTLAYEAGLKPTNRNL
jgi:Zn finger protein HypA/HybF involved in hydrogenase expression